MTLKPLRIGLPPAMGLMGGSTRMQDEELARAPLLNSKILVLEDDPFIGLDICSVLEEAGADVLGPAHNLKEAHSLLDSVRPSVAILDYRLGGGTSTSIGRALTDRGIPFLFLTSDPHRAGRDFPGAMIISKPFVAEKLTAAVRSLLADR